MSSNTWTKMFHRWYSANVPVGFSIVSLSFIYSGVPQGEGEAAAPRHSQQRSDASHHHPAALVPGLSDKIALPAKERCHYDYTGIITNIKDSYILWIALLECLLGVPANITNIQKDLRIKNMKVELIWQDFFFSFFSRGAGVSFMRSKTELPQLSRQHGGLHWRGHCMRQRMTRRCPIPGLDGSGIHTVPIHRHCSQCRDWIKCHFTRLSDVLHCQWLILQ